MNLHGIRFDEVEDGFELGSRAGVPYNPLTDRVIARHRDGELLGGVTYTGYTGASINIHMAGFVTDWVNKDMIWVAFHYPFVQLGVNKMFGQVPASNQTALDLNRRLGFTEELRVSDVFPDGDLVVFSMYRDRCRWLKLKGHV
jgi:hypothetical protein